MKLHINLLTAFIMFSCSSTPPSDRAITFSSTHPSGSVVGSSLLNKLFTINDAGRKLGEPAILTDSSSSHKDEYTYFTNSYSAKEKDAKTGKTGAVYFLAEQFGTISSAQKKYAFIKTSNETHKGIEKLDNLGDEAYFHSDSENFYFIMVRKSNTVFTMKVNKITSTTSLENFHRVAREIAAKI